MNQFLAILGLKLNVQKSAAIDIEFNGRGDNEEGEDEQLEDAGQTSARERHRQQIGPLHPTLRIEVQILCPRQVTGWMDTSGQNPRHGGIGVPGIKLELVVLSASMVATWVLTQNEQIQLLEVIPSNAKIVAYQGQN
ncbi:unnamed protein product [Phytophthora fragariaefolia]|uniref:Unnamed protein product n=1 Tax=Phytophthora fragariaefolia TaxID=1490495 RepID=A0A9W7D602_9STRA|nr:unnamed protein product [Phytophthora fragariaefolia]